MNDDQGTLLPAEVARGEVAVNTDNPMGARSQNLLRKAETPEMLTAATATIKELIAAYNTQEDRQAERDFAKGMTALQGEIPTLIAQKKVLNRDQSLRYKCKPYAEVLAEVKPYLSRHGFSVMSDCKWENERGVAVLQITHDGGHSRVREFSVIRSDPPPGGTPTEAEEGTLTRALRRGLCAALNIAVSPEDEHNARDEGDTIAPETAAKLKRRLEAICADEKERQARTKDFLEFAHAEDFEHIREARLPGIEQTLARAEEKSMTRGKAEQADGGAGTDAAPPEADPDGDEWDKYTDLVQQVSDEYGCPRDLVLSAIKGLPEGLRSNVDAIVGKVRLTRQGGRKGKK